MTSLPFDPEAATQAYLATLPPSVQTQAVAYTQGGYWILLASWAIGVAVCWIIARSGLLDRISQRFAGVRPRPNLLAFVCATAFFFVQSVLLLPWAVYSGWWRESQFGLTNQVLAGWAVEHGIQSVISAIMTGLFFVGVYALIRRLPRWWSVGATALTAVFLVLALVAAPVFVLPIFNDYQPAPEGPVRTAVEGLAVGAGIRGETISVYDGSRQSNRFTANVAGIGPTARIALSDTMFRQGAEIDEIKAVVSHEIGHYQHQHLLFMAFAFALLFGLGFFLIGRLFPAASGLFGLGDRPLSDPVALPVMIALASTLLLAATPLINTVQRAIELDADNFSLDQARLPDALATALLKSADYRAPSPSALEETLFYDHPSIARRIRNAMAWKARHASRQSAVAPLPLTTFPTETP